MRYLDLIRRNSKKILFFIFILALLCVVSYLIYHNVSKANVSCVLSREYENYKTTMIVDFNRDKTISFEEVFETADKDILKTKRVEATLLEYNFNVLKNKIIVKHKVQSERKINDLVKEYVASGYSCTNKKTVEKKIDYRLENYSTYQEVGTPYQEVVINAFSDEKDLSSKVLVDNNSFDPNTIGNYVVTYRLSLSDVRDEYLYRVIHVEDNTPPTLKLKGKEEITLKKNEKYEEEGVEVSDNYDKDMKDRIKKEGTVDTSKLGEYEIVYEAKDSSGNKSSVTRKVKVVTKGGIIPTLKEENGITYFDGVAIVNKKYTVPKDYDPGLRDDTYNAFTSLQKGAKKKGYAISILSGYRSYATQQKLHESYIKKYGKEKAKTFSAEAGHSEHQTGLALDVGMLDTSFGNTKEGKWLASHAHEYGFILRYPKGKEKITGYEYEPWHIRYLGKDMANKVYKSGLTLEEYFGIDE